tara:strand:- start:256 stop:612 length:357 start_codon:yes stop_codon:yes gene_type:complete
MEFSSPRFKSMAVTLGFSFWFFVISSSLGFFTLEIFGIFIIILFTLTQIFTKKLSKILDAFAIFNSKIFLGIIYISVISLYGIFFKILKIDILRLKKQNDSYWLDIEQLNEGRLVKQY